MKYPCEISTPSDVLRTNKPEFVDQLTHQVIRQYQICVAQKRLSYYMYSHQICLAFYVITCYVNDKTLSHQFPKFSLHRRFQIHMYTHTLNMLPFHNRNSILLKDREIYLYAHFPGSHFVHITRPSRIQSHDTSQLFIPTSTLFVSIITLTKTGECCIS